MLVREINAWRGGLLLLRHVTPLTRRYVVYFCSGAYTNGGRQGAPNYIYYALAAAQATGNCNSSTPPLTGSNCAFQDITRGDNLICGTSTCTSSTGTHMGFQAAVGYDLATGLGSVNAANLANQWKTVVFNSSNTTLNLDKTSGISQGDSITFSGNVAAGSGNGTPTGEVAFILSQGAFGSTVSLDTGALNDPGAFATLDGSGNFTATLKNLPGGTFNVTARYAGDQTYASSLSAPVPVTVTPGNSVVTITPEWFNDTVTCSASIVSSYNYGQFAWIPAAVTSSTGQGKPTGTVTFTVDDVAYATETLDPQANAYLAAGTLATTSCLYDFMFAQSPTLTGGTHVIGASYSGDATFSAATATPVTITVNPLTVTPTLAAGATLITSGFADQLTATFTTSALTGISTMNSGPTGTVTYTDTTTSTVLGTAPVVPTRSFSGNTYTYAATAILSTTAITQTGANAITATYSGDSNFNATTSAAVTVTVGTGTATTTTVTSSANPTTLNGRPTFTATIAGGTAPTAGTVTFYDGAAVLGTGTVGSGHTATFRPASGAPFFGGAHSVTATFGGNTTFMASTSAPLTENVTQGTNTIVVSTKLVGTAGSTYALAALLTPSPTVTGPFAPNRGQVQFFDGATNIGSATAITITSGQGGYGLWNAVLTVNNLTAGTHSITASYSDVNYATATSAAVSLFVGGTPTITWATPAAITYPAAISATQLNATANIPGTFAYTPAASTVLNAGSQTLSVKFTPTDYTDFAPQTQTVQLQVNQEAQTITFPTVPTQTYGGGPVTLGASATSTLAVSYAVTSGPATVVGNILTYSGAGAVTVQATQAGNTNWAAATPVSQTFNVLPPAPAISLAPGTYVGPQNVSVSDTLAGSVFYYTVDGTTPTTSSASTTIGSIWVQNSTTSAGGPVVLNVIAVKGGQSSVPATATYTIQTAAPTFSEPGGTYATAQSISLSGTTYGANASSIHYTVDGSTPTAASPSYTGPISITNGTVTISAVAHAPFLSNSTVASATYTVTAALPTPRISLAGGSYIGAQNVTVSDSLAGVTFYYTLDGTAPTTSSTSTTGSIWIQNSSNNAGAPIILTVIAGKTGATSSASATATYSISTAAPTFSVPAGTYPTAQSIALSSTTSGATIHYTLDGSAPTTSSPVYTTPISITNGTVTIKATAHASFLYTSTVASATYTVTAALPTPSLSLAGGSYIGAQNVIATDSLAGVTFYYTIDGTTPTTASASSTGSIWIQNSSTNLGAPIILMVIAGKSGSTSSAVATATYSISTAAPTFSSAAGSYPTAQSITLSSVTPGAVIHYTTDGSTPTLSSPTYAAPISITNGSMTIKALAHASNMYSSTVAAASYTVTAALPTPTLSIPAGTYSGAQDVLFHDSVAGVTFYYTTDGSTPTTSSSATTAGVWLQTSSAFLGAPITLNVIAVKSGSTTSAVASATYQIDTATPAFSVPGGTYGSAQSVILSSATSGATIHYTTDGSTPTLASPTYTGAIAVTSGTVTIKAIAHAGNMYNSVVASATYTIIP